ncbi:hypothetical protein Sango_2798300 [Sesamum angolense]|uniref:Uncharacterized protein n=1 Tax=Sesamum angolense TaxID=2727404 RepID=A0AAE1T7Y8_9LAMI|nr:hypothetical protein Sango_2977200 [Sesamum angolense]KAK4383208.1 hypothetical protein Sango_2798300 [Sesamum angolense]
MGVEKKAVKKKLAAKKALVERNPKSVTSCQKRKASQLRRRHNFHAISRNQPSVLKVEKPKVEMPMDENETRITNQRKMQSYITYAMSLLQKINGTKAGASNFKFFGVVE